MKLPEHFTLYSEIFPPCRLTRLRSGVANPWDLLCAWRYDRSHVHIASLGRWWHVQVLSSVEGREEHLVTVLKIGSGSFFNNTLVVHKCPGWRWASVTKNNLVTQKVKVRRLGWDIWHRRIPFLLYLMRKIVRTCKSCDVTNCIYGHILSCIKRYWLHLGWYAYTWLHSLASFFVTRFWFL